MDYKKSLRVAAQAILEELGYTVECSKYVFAPI